MKRTKLLRCLVMVTMWAVAGMAAADVKLPSVFSDHMLLQRGLAVPVWGWSEAGEKVTVRFAGQEKQAVGEASGQWMVRLDPLRASDQGRPLEIEGANRLVLQDVLVGDVWICSGQSNMEWSVNGTMNAEEEVAAAEHPAIRLFDVRGHVTSPVPLADLSGTWQLCSPETVPGFSAVGYFFGRAIHRECGVPVGLIGTNWGGTRIEPWVAPVGFRSVPELEGLAQQVNQFDPSQPAGKATWQNYVDSVDSWLGQAQAALQTGALLPAPVPVPGFREAGQPTAIYNAMVYPLAPYGLRGAIWYQGESNGSEGVEYFHKMQALIEGWRDVWGQGDFPLYFYFVQLANWQQAQENPAGGDGWARLREAQTAALSIPHTGMAVTIDIGEANDIHPRDKQDVGSRLARWALRDVCGQDVVVSGPLYRAATVEDNKMRVRFDHVGSGLMVGQKQGLEPTQEVANGTLTRFAVAGEDRQWQWAEARIDGDTVLAWSDAVPHPVAVRYAYAMNPAGANLYNKEGLPASPFRSDDW